MVRRKRPYLHFSDRPIFKAVGMVCTTAYFLIGYFPIFMRQDLGVGSLLGLLYPCVMIVVWESIKKRNFWPFWLIGASVCLLVLSRYDDTSAIGSLAVNVYWLSAFVCCCFLILCYSRAERRFRRREEDAKVVEVSIHDPVKDAFLEELFNKK